MTLIPVRDEPATLLVAPDTDSWTAVVSEVAKLAAHIAGTEFVPRGLRDNPAAVCAAILYGREVGLPPMTALGQVYVADGKPSMHAEGMRALVVAAGHDIEVVEHTGAVCTVRGRRAGHEWSKPLTWNLDMARAAGLLPAKAGSGWMKYPRSMLLARASAELCRRDFPDVIHGLIAVEELDDTPTSTDETSSPPTKVRRTRTTKAQTPPVPTLPEPPNPSPPKVAGQPEVATSHSPLPPPPPPDREQATPPAPVGSDVDPEPGGEATGSGSTPHDEGTTEPAERDADPDIGPGPRQPTEGDRKRTIGQRTAIIAGLAEFKVRDRDDRLATCSALVGRVLESSNDLTYKEATTILDTLALCQDEDDLSNAVTAALEHYGMTDHPDYPDQPSLLTIVDTELPDEPEETGHTR